MGTFVKGEIVVLPFPFSDLSASKRRPAFVLADLEGDDIILCQITGKLKIDRYSIELNDKHFKEGSLNLTSNIRPNRIFTADAKIVCYKVGKVSDEKVKEVKDMLLSIFS